MKRNARQPVAAAADPEPIGIVISHGPAIEQAPTFAAYIWSAEPETESAEPAQAA